MKVGTLDVRMISTSITKRIDMEIFVYAFLRKFLRKQKLLAKTCKIKCTKIAKNFTNIFAKTLAKDFEMLTFP
jgi:hypothetical protein